MDNNEFNNQENNSITYDENWKNVTQPEYVVNSNEDTKETDEEKFDIVKENKKNKSKQLVILVQLIVCILIAITAFAIKNIGGEIYKNAHDLYYSTLNSSIIFDNNNNFDLSKLFATATKDEV